MTTILCNQCEKYKIELEGKNQEIAILKKNSLELKSQLFENNNLITAYIQMKTQYDSLMKENELLKKKKDDTNDRYQFEILKQKLIQKTNQNNGLIAEVEELNKAIENYKRKSQDNLLNTKENKLKRELSEKDKFINNQNLIIERLKNEKNQQNYNLKAYNNTNDGFGMEEENIYNNENQIKVTELLKEKAFLDEEYRKYKAKYIKYKYKYKEFRNNAQFFMKYYSNNNLIMNKDVELLKIKRDRLASEYMEEEIDKRNNMNNKSHKASIDYGNNNASDIFDNKLDEEMDLEINNTFTENHEQIKEDIVKVEKEEPKEKEKKKKNSKEVEPTKMQTRAMEKEKKKQTSPSKEEEKKETKKTQSKKVKKEKNLLKEEENKLIIGKEEEDQTIKNIQIKEEEKNKINNIKIKTEEEQKVNNSQIKTEENSVKKAVLPHINPIKKQKINQESKMELTSSSLTEYLSSININDIKEDSLFSLFQSLKTLTEKITFILEGIISNISKLDLSKVIIFIKLFIKTYGRQTPSSLSIISTNFLEFINLHVKTLIQSKHKFITNESNPYYSDDIIKENNRSLHLITFIIDILFNELQDVSIISKFLFNFILNKSSNTFVTDGTLKEISKLVNKSYISNPNKIFINENELLLYKNASNNNSFYFLSLFKTRLISGNIFNLLISIYNNLSSSDIDTLISSLLLEDLNKIPEESLLSVEKKDKLSLNTDTIYLEIFQIITLSFCVRDSIWNSQYLFSKALWEQFSKTKDFSLKRAFIIYFTSLICYLSIKNGTKSNEFYWLYAIYKPDDDTGRFSFYDKICALSWIVDSSFITMFEKFFNIVKSSVEKLSKEYPIDYFPSDFLSILKKHKII